MANELIGEKREGDVRVSSSGGAPILEETYIFTVMAHSKNTPRAEVLSTPGLPRRGVTRSAYGLTVCKSISGSRSDENPRLWEFTCDFSSDVEEGQDSQDLETDPVVWKPVYRQRFERYTEPLLVDADGTPVTNSVGQAFSGGLTVPRLIPIWTLYQFEPATVTDEQVLERSEVVNSVEFKGRAAYTLLCNVVSSEMGFYYGQRRRLTQYELRYNFRNWRAKWPDRGTAYIDGDGVYRAYTLIEKKGSPPTDHDTGIVINGPLNGAGGKLADGAAPVLKLLDIYKPVPFKDFLRV